MLLLPRALLAGVLVVFSSFATAVPLAYSESISGDITGSPAFALDAGVNTVQGEMALVLHWDTSGRPVFVQADLDAFNFTLPVGTTLTSATIEPVFTDTTGRTTEASLYTFLMYAGNTLSEDHCFHLFGTNGNLCEGLIGGVGDFAPGLLPRADTTFGLGYSFVLDSPDHSLDYGGKTNYVITLEVRAVDEPPAAMLLTMGLLAVGLQRRARAVRKAKLLSSSQA